jgi:hypothetical protein
VRGGAERVRTISQDIMPDRAAGDDAAGCCRNSVIYAPVRTENSIHVNESPNVGDDDPAILPLRCPVRIAVQVEEPT